MLATSNGKFLNPFRAVQAYDGIGRPDHKFHNIDEWELPRGAMAEMIQWGPTISVPQELFGQLTRFYARTLTLGLVKKELWGLFQFVAKVSFDSGDHGGYLASIFLRMSG